MKDKKVAIVTGGTRGMGAAISVELATRGNIVCALYRNNEKTAKATKQKLREIEPLCDVYPVNTGSELAVDEIVKKIGEKFGHIDILVNNAGIFDFRFIEEMDGEYLDNVLTNNFKSQFFMMRAVLPYMKKISYGRVINASSISGKFADCGLVAYAASKASVDMLTTIGAAELGAYNITVNAYAPGIIHTDMTDAMIQERGNEQLRDIALSRFGKGEDVASLVGFLSSEEAGYLTGEIIGIDGGMFKVQNTYLAQKYAKKIAGRSYD